MSTDGREITRLELMERPCKSCPFEGTDPVPLTPARAAEVRSDVTSLKGQHLCHTAHDRMLCRGGRNLMLRTLVKRGLIAAATDEAFTKASQRWLGQDFTLRPSRRHTSA
jgi:hypothetical protein